jgi:hypothetical protein
MRCAAGGKSGGRGAGVEGLRTDVPSTGPLCSLCSGIFDQSTARRRLKRRHIAAVENTAFRLWSLMNFIAWHRQITTPTRPSRL